MPLVRNTANFNIRKRPGPRRKYSFFSVAGPTLAASPVPLSGSADIEVLSESEIRVSINALGTYDESNGYGREAKIHIESTGFLELETYPLDPESAFVMIKRVSPIMPNPLPLDSKGRPT